MLGGLVSATTTAPWAIGAAVSQADLVILASLGCFQLGLFLFVRGSRKLRAAELGLLTLAGNLLAPIWEWIGIGKTPSAVALLGGSIVLAAVIGLTLGERTPPLPAADAKPGS